MAKEFSWTAPEFIHYPKSKWWFIILLLLGAILTIYFLAQKDFLTAVLFALFLIIIFYFAKVPPKIIHIEISSRGIKLNTNLLPYQQIKSFWFVYEPPTVKTLNFETTMHFNRFLTLQLMDQDPVEIHKFLLEFLPEDLDRGEQFSDKISRTLKF